MNVGDFGNDMHIAPTYAKQVDRHSRIGFFTKELIPEELEAFASQLTPHSPESTSFPLEKNPCLI